MNITPLKDRIIVKRISAEAEIYNKQFDALTYSIFPENKIEVAQ